MFCRRTLASFLYIWLVVGLFCCACQSLPSRRPIPDSNSNDTSALQQLLASFNYENVQEHIIALTSPAYEGRKVGTEGEQKAAAYLTKLLNSWQLQPWVELGLNDYTHEFPIPNTDLVGQNIIAVFPGHSDRWLLLVAHYDHLGVNKGQLYPGADDNGAAVAILLEIARCLTTTSLVPEHNVVFVFSSGEEKGLSGSKALAQLLQAGQLVPRSRVINLDMLGGTGGNSLDIWCEPAQPWEKNLESQIRQAIGAAGLKSQTVKRRFAAVDSRSFAQAGIPSITLSWAYERRYHPHRHSPNDTWERLQPLNLQKAGRAILRGVWTLANTSD